MEFQKREQLPLIQSCFSRTDGLILPTKDALILLHDKIIELHKDMITRGIRSPENLDFFIDKILNKKFEKDALTNSFKVSEEIMFEMACRHPFSDGNKRTALFASLFFLTANLENYVNKKNQESYFVKYDSEKEIQQAKEVELIAQWSEHDCPLQVKELIVSSGIPVKERVTEQHVRMFMNQFLRKYLQKIEK